MTSGCFHVIIYNYYELFNLIDVETILFIVLLNSAIS